jgi:methylamine utilization protein MauE
MTGRTLLKKKIAIEIISSLLIILFIYTGLNKMMDYSSFKFTLGRSPFIQHLNGPIAVLLPAGELLTALVLVIKRTRLIGLYASYFLMVLFTGYIWIMLHYAYDLPCSCGGVLAQLSWKDHLIFNMAFTLLALVGVLLQSSVGSAVVSNKIPVTASIL